jgi:hypothetical protein
MKKVSILQLIFLYVVSMAPAYAQQPRVISEAVVSPPQSGGHDQYDIEADPDNANNLIACGMKWNALDNAYYGYVYASQDAGTTWHTALEDTHSKWVSEESCAFGVHGVAYFIADASKIDNTGELHHDHGTTRIWVSHDSGRTWTLGTTAGWTDFSASVVDRNSGPDQNRLYVFFNSLWMYYISIDDKQALDRIPKSSKEGAAGSTIGLISYKDGDDKAREPIFDPGMYKQLYHGSYPSQNLLLKDGSLLTLFWSKVRLLNPDGSRKGRKIVLAAQHTEPDRKAVSEPVNIFTFPDISGQSKAKCDSYLSAPATYNFVTNTVYATYLDGSNGECTLMLAKSIDNGQTWSAHPWVEKADSHAKDATPTQHDYDALAMARRDDGTLALLWHDSDQPDCWLFSTSTDSGETYSHPQQISTCTSGNDGKYRLTAAGLDLHISQANSSTPSDDADLQIKNHFGFGNSHTSGIAVTGDGVFHPAWIANDGQLYTAAIAVTKPHDRSRPESPRTDGWQYETNRVKFLYGGSQHYDEDAHVLTESVILLNSGTEPLRAPLRLEIEPSSRVGILYALDVTTEGSGDSIAQYLDIDQYIPGDGLPPGASSTPIPLRFHFEPYSDAKQGGFPGNVSLRLLMKEGK